MRSIIKIFLALAVLLLLTVSAFAQQRSTWQGKFEQLDNLLPTPNAYRTGSGAPGSAYWQQRADYVIDVEVNDKTQELTGHETITYYNQSPERSEEHTSELQSLMRISYAVFCLKKKKKHKH